MALIRHVLFTFHSENCCYHFQLVEVLEYFAFAARDQLGLGVTTGRPVIGCFT